MNAHFLARDLGHTKGWWITMIGLLLVLSYFIVRVVGGIWYTVFRFWPSVWAHVDLLSTYPLSVAAMLVYAFLGSTTSTILNVSWFYVLLKVAAGKQ